MAKIIFKRSDIQGDWEPFMCEDRPSDEGTSELSEVSDHEASAFSFFFLFFLFVTGRTHANALG